MASITIPARVENHPHLRPLNIFRDLSAVADLIELCFSDTMDHEGRRYVQEMRRAGGDHAWMNWASRAVEGSSLPLTGYIWEEGGDIVGNASLVSFRHQKERITLIANVAVHPAHRRRGIARALTGRAMEHAREKNVDNIWLHVREDHSAAVALYQSLGFVERARRTTWQARTDLHAPALETGLVITRRHPAHWPAQSNWLSRLYPSSLAWYRNWNFHSLRPGFWNWLYLLLTDVHAHQWAAVRPSLPSPELQATLSWIPYSRGESLFAAAGQGSAPEALTALLIQARRDIYHTYPGVALEFPSGCFDSAIQAAGFQPLRTLIWMQAAS